MLVGLIFQAAWHRSLSNSNLDSVYYFVFINDAGVCYLVYSIKIKIPSRFVELLRMRCTGMCCNLLMLKDYQFAAVDLLSQMVRKEAFLVVHFRIFFNRCKVSKRMLAFCRKLNGTKEQIRCSWIANPNGKQKSHSKLCTWESFPKKRVRLL